MSWGRGGRGRIYSAGAGRGASALRRERFESNLWRVTESVERRWCQILLGSWDRWLRRGTRSEVSCPGRALWGWMAIGDGEDSGQIHTPDGELEIVRVRAFVGVVAARVDLCAARF